MNEIRWSTRLRIKVRINISLRHTARIYTWRTVYRSALQLDAIHMPSVRQLSKASAIGTIRTTVLHNISAGVCL